MPRMLACGAAPGGDSSRATRPPARPRCAATLRVINTTAPESPDAMAEARSLRKLKRLLGSGVSPECVDQFVVAADIEHGDENWRDSVSDELAQWKEKATAAKEVADKESVKAAATRAAARADAEREGISVVAVQLAAATIYERSALERLFVARKGQCLRIDQSAKLGHGSHEASELRRCSIQGYDPSQLLLDVHPDARETYADGDFCTSALTDACICGHLHVVEVLLRFDADPNLQEVDEHGKPKEGTALHFAAMHNRPDTVSCLLQHGAKMTARNQYGRTALEEARGRAGPEVMQLLSSDSPPLRSFWDGTLPLSTALALQMLTSGDAHRGGSVLTYPIDGGLISQLDADMLRLVAGWLCMEDANELARTCIGLYAVLMQYERSARLRYSTSLAHLRRRPVNPSNVQEATRVLKELRFVPLESERAGRERCQSYSLTRWALFDSLLGVLGGSNVSGGGGARQEWGSGQWLGDATTRSILSMMASMIDSTPRMRHAGLACQWNVPDEAHADRGVGGGLFWLVQLVAYAPTTSEACRLVQKLSSCDRLSNSSDTLGHLTEEMMEAQCVPAVILALDSPSTCSAAASALAALVDDEISHSSNSDELPLATKAMELGVVPMLLAQAVVADLAAATAALDALAVLFGKTEASDTAHADGFISTLVALMATHVPSQPRGIPGKTQRVALVSAAARALSNLVSDAMNGCDEVVSDLRCEEMLAAGAKEALSALLAFPGAAGNAEVAMSYVPRPGALEQTSAYMWLAANAPPVTPLTLTRVYQTLLRLLASDCIQLGMRVAKPVHQQTGHGLADSGWLAHDLGHYGRYHKVRRALIDAANLRLGDACKLSSIYYRLEEEADKFEGSIVGTAPSGGTQGRIICFRTRSSSQEAAVYRFYDEPSGAVKVKVVRAESNDNVSWFGLSEVSCF